MTYEVYRVYVYLDDTPTHDKEYVFQTKDLAYSYAKLAVNILNAFKAPVAIVKINTDLQYVVDQIVKDFQLEEN